LAKKAQNRHFGAILGPWGLPGTPGKRGFYINPSLREAREGLPGPLEGPRRALREVPNPGRGSSWPQGPGRPRDRVPDAPARG